MSFIIDQALIDQIAVLFILGTALILFIKDRWRYDVVALLVLLSLIFIGVLSVDGALSYFGHPAVIIVASMFVMGRALVLSGIVDAVVGRLTFLHNRPILSLGVLVVLVTIISAFVNNVGALVMVLPIAIHLAKKNHTPIALYLLPLAFASHLGGYLTLIGTPRNILISNFREDVTGQPYLMFDFSHVGIFIAGAGVLFLILIAWRMIPLRGREINNNLPIRIYTTEVAIPDRSKLTKLSLAKIESLNHQIKVLSVVKDELIEVLDKSYKPMADDILQIQGDSDALSAFVDKYKLELSGLRAIEKNISSDDEHKTIEAVVTPYATVIGKSWNEINFSDRYGVNFIGLARRNHKPNHSIATTRFQSGDIVMLQGRVASVNKTLETMNCMIVSEEALSLGRTSSILGTLIIFITAITIASLQILPIAIVFLTAAIAMVIFNLISIKEAYESIDPAVLMLLAGMIALGGAIQSTGVDQTLSELLLSLNGLVGPVEMLFIVLITTMLLSDFMNTTASVVVMAPVAITIAQTLNVSVDPFLMTVAIGSAASYLTPVGHESNALVMHRGGYKFTDYIKIGLPIELLQVAITVPLILHHWPL
jgi:di/tricarboxylate transporter